MLASSMNTGRVGWEEAPTVLVEVGPGVTDVEVAVAGSSTRELRAGVISISPF